MWHLIIFTFMTNGAGLPVENRVQMIMPSQDVCILKREEYRQQLVRSMNRQGHAYTVQAECRYEPKVDVE